MSKTEWEHQTEEEIAEMESQVEEAMAISEKRLASIHNRRDFSLFVEELLRQYKDNPNEWGQNRDIASYLEAVSVTTHSVKDSYADQDDPPTWREFAEILSMATDYE